MFAPILPRPIIPICMNHLLVIMIIGLRFCLSPPNKRHDTPFTMFSACEQKPDSLLRAV